MDLFREIYDFLLLEKNNINQKINNINSEIAKLSNNIRQLSLISKEICNDIEKVDAESLYMIISQIDSNLITVDDLKRIDEIKKVAKFIYNPQIPYLGVKKEMLDYLNKFSKKIDSLILGYDQRIKLLNASLETYKNNIFNIDNYLVILSDQENIFDISYDQFNMLFDFLDNLSISKVKLFDFISFVIIGKLKKQEELEIQRSIELENNIEEVSKKIDENSEKIIGVKKEKKKSKDIDLSKLNVDERVLLEQLETIFKEKNIQTSSGFNLLIENYFSDGINFDERMECYMVGDNLDWDTFFADYYTNLLPNIGIYKDIILEIVKKVIEQYNVEKRDNTSELEILSFEIRRFRDINSATKNILSEYYENMKELTLNLSSDEFLIISDIISEINRLLEDTISMIESNSIKSEELIKVNSKLDELLDKYKMIVNIKSRNESDVELGNAYKLETTKTMLLLLKNKDNEFVPISEINKENDIEKNNVMSFELQKAIVKISGAGMSDSKKRFRSSHVVKTTRTGKEIDLEKHFGFDVDRIRFSEDGRTGYVIVPVCENNRKKLVNIYGQNIFFQNYNSIIMIVSSIKVSADHYEYEHFKELISENIDYIDYVLKLFSNPNADINEMSSIIEESALECKELSSSYQRGGK